MKCLLYLSISNFHLFWSHYPVPTVYYNLLIRMYDRLEIVLMICLHLMSYRICGCKVNYSKIFLSNGLNIQEFISRPKLYMMHSRILILLWVHVRCDNWRSFCCQMNAFGYFSNVAVIIGVLLLLLDASAGHLTKANYRPAAQRRSGSGNGYVDFGAHTGPLGSYGWYADFPANKN